MLKCYSLDQMKSCFDDCIDDNFDDDNDDNIGGKAMQASGIGTANTQFDSQCNFPCNPPISIGYQW